MINVNGTKFEWKKNYTITKMLKDCNFDGVPIVMVKINGTFYKKNQFPITKIPDDAIVRVVHLIHGG